MDEDLDAFMNGEVATVRAKAYDMVLNGCELGGGSIRIHRDDIQEQTFRLLSLDKEVAQERLMPSSTVLHLMVVLLSVLIDLLCSLQVQKVSET